MSQFCNVNTCKMKYIRQSVMMLAATVFLVSGFKANDRTGKENRKKRIFL